MDAADLSPIPEQNRTQSPFDLFLIFAAANVVATTLQTGAVLGARYGTSNAMLLVVSGAVFGSLLVALLAPVGSRSGVPSMIAARAPLGRYGAWLVAALLYLTNFAWIAINNNIAASVVAQVAGGPGSAKIWSAILGLAATAVVVRGPRAVGMADRIAVPMMVVAGSVLTWAAISKAFPPAGPPMFIDSLGGIPPNPVDPVPSIMFGLDVIVGYQVSWLLMFADYSRYTRSPRAAATAVFAGLALPALWLMPVGWTLARVAQSDDTGALLTAAGTGWWTAVLVTLATVTTNFVNIYLSSLAWRTLVPKSTSGGSVWTIGLIGTALGLVSSGWLDRYAELMLILATILLPVGGVFLAHFVILKRPVDISFVYDISRLPGINWAGVVAWIAGIVVYQLAQPIGATLPALATSIVVYVAVSWNQWQNRNA